MLTLVLVASLAQLPSRPAPKRPPRVRPEQLIPTLIAPGTKWSLRSEAVSELMEPGRTLTQKDLALLEKAWFILKHTPHAECAPGQARECGIGPGPCLSPAGYILAAASIRHDWRERFVGIAAQALEARSDPSALSYARMIVTFNDQPARQPEARRLLASEDSVCVGEATAMLEDLEAWEPATIQALEDAVTHAAPNPWQIGRLVARRTEPWAEALAERFLTHLDGNLRAGFLAGTRDRFPKSERLRTVLAQIATCDPSPRNVSQAKRLFETAKVPLPAVTCPSSRWTVSGRTVRGPSSEVTLGDVSTVPPPLAGCPSQAGRPLGTVGGACILGVDAGEFGGALLRWSGSGEPVDVARRRDGLNPRALVSRGDEVLVVSALEHMLGSGSLGRLTRDGGKTVQYEPLARFDGVPIAWGTDGTRFFVTLRQQDFMGPCVEQTLVLEPDGSSSLAAGGTSCVR